MLRRILRGLLVLLLCPLAAEASQTFVPADYGLTARGVAMGNAMTAVEGDGSLIYANPAAMAKTSNSYTNFGYMMVAPRLQGGPKGDMDEFDEGNNFVLTNLVLNLNPLLKADRPLAFGLSMYFDRNMRSLIQFVDVEDPDGHFYRYGRTSTMATNTLGLGVTDWLYVGGGALITLRGETDFKVTTDLAGNTSDEGMILDARLYYSPVASIFLDFERVDIGVAYHGENYGYFGDIVTDAQANVGDSRLADLPLVLQFQDTFVPTNVAVGASFKITDDFLAAVEGTWYHWGRFDEQVSSNDLPREDIDIDFVDTYVPRVGLEYHLTESLPVRAGYSYQMTPMRKAGSRNNVFLDNDRHVGSFGLGYTFQDPPVFATPVSIDASYFHMYLVPNETEVAGGATYESEGNVNGGIASLTLRF
ncbi:outer membrane protein transport protein [bacterium]|nr:outer membrane protein transport protein [bacterium]